MSEKTKNIIIAVLAVCLATSLLALSWVNSKYSKNEQSYQSQADSLCTIISLNKTAYDSLKIHSDSVYEYQVNKSDSLYQLLQTKTNTSRTKVTYIYKDSTVIREGENIQQETMVETKYVDRVIEKEVIKTIHDTVQVTKVDSVFDQKSTATSKSVIEKKSEVIVKDDLFNVYLDVGVKGNLDYDIIPELGAGIIIKEKFYAEIGVNYSSGEITPTAKLGLRLNVF